MLTFGHSCDTCGVPYTVDRLYFQDGVYKCVTHLRGHSKDEWEALNDAVEDFDEGFVLPDLRRTTRSDIEEDLETPANNGGFASFGGRTPF